MSDAEHLVEQFEIAGIGLGGNQVLLGALQALLGLGQKRSHDFFAIKIHSFAFFLLERLL